MKVWQSTLAALAIASTSALVTAQDFPKKDVSVIVITSPGTATDIAARMTAAGLAKQWNVPVTVDNKVGANGIIGSDIVAKSKPDGHTMLVTGVVHYVNRKLYKSLPNDPVKDFIPVSRISSTYLILIAPQSSPFNNIQDVVAYAKANPGKVTYSTAGNGSSTHLAAALLASMTGIELKHVPYKGAAQAFTDLVGGHVSLSFVGAQVAEQLPAGRIKALGITSPKRTQLLPNLPTIAEQGVPGFEMVVWASLMAPAGTPAAVIRQTDAAVARALADPAFATRLRSQYMELDYRNTEQLAKELAVEVQRWDNMVRISGAQLD